MSLLFSLLGGAGIGQLYNGRWRKAALFCLAVPPLYCLGVGLTVRLPVRLVNLIPLALPLGWAFAAAVDAVRDASRPRVAGPRPWYSHGAFCTWLALLNAFVWGPTWVGATRVAWAQAYTIPTGAMEPTILAGDHLFADKSAYGFRNPISGAMPWRRREPTRGELIVFVFPEDRTRDYLKRVIGLPGETVQIRNKQVLINGEPLVEPYAQFIEGQSLIDGEFAVRDNWGPQMVPNGHFFVLGDNRDNSRDSRFWGFLPVEDVRGEARLVYYSYQARRPIGTRTAVSYIRGTLEDFFQIRWRRIGVILR